MLPAAARSRRSPSSSAIIAKAASAPTATRADSTALDSSCWYPKSAGAAGLSAPPGAGTQPARAGLRPGGTQRGRERGRDADRVRKFARGVALAAGPAQPRSRPGELEPEPDRLAAAPVGNPPRGRQRGGQQQAAATGAFGRARLAFGRLGDQPRRVPVADDHLDRAVGQPARNLHRRARVHHGVGDQLAGQQDRVVDQPVPIGCRTGHQPRLERLAHKPPRGGSGRRLRLVRRARDEIVWSHAPLGSLLGVPASIVTDSRILSSQFSNYH